PASVGTRKRGRRRKCLIGCGWTLRQKHPGRRQQTRSKERTGSNIRFCLHGHGMITLLSSCKQDKTIQN
ncbi:MAG: hypothetical protein HFH26_06450, partial [Clostridiaceae bacterium]|nr:hypothetical protein [Clostridiaceae bacterium]